MKHISVLWLIFLFLLIGTTIIKSAGSDRNTPIVNISSDVLDNPNRIRLAQTSETQADRDYWKSIERSDNIEDYKSYLEWFPNGQYISQAKSAIERLKGKRQTESRQSTSVDTFKDCDVCPEMVMLPEGSYSMGSPESEVDRDKDEGPVHRVNISRPFAIGQFELTFDEWDACVAERGCRHRPGDQGWGRGKLPVINVSWHDVTSQYIRWLNRKTGRKYRLPSEAEWEYAARGGTSTQFWMGNTVSSDQANYFEEAVNGSGNSQNRDRTVPVDSFRPNSFGLHNVHGNVSEWVQDCWHKNYSGAPQDGRAWLRSGRGNCSYRVIRGGSWGNSSWFIRSAERREFGSGTRNDFIGFRVALSLD